MPVVDRRRVTFFTSKKVTKEGRQRTLRRVLWNPREYLAITRRLPPLPTGTLAEGSIQVADAPNDRSWMARRGHTAENNARSGRSRALRACAAKPRSFPPSRGTCERNKSGRVSPMGTPGTVPETHRQRHCARGAAAGGMLYTRPLIRGRAPPTLAAGQPEAARGSRGRSPLRLLSPISCPYKKWGRPPGRDPASSAASRAAYLKRRHPPGRERKAPPLLERQTKGPRQPP